MTKQTFTIPEGCKAVTVEQVGNQIITTFEPEFKRGDVLISKEGAICIFDKSCNGVDFYELIGLVRRQITKSNAHIFGQTKDYRHATPEEAQLLLDALAKEGKRWNPETMQVEEIKKERWRAKKKERYYYVNSILYVVSETESGYSFDSIRHQSGNHFQTEEQAKRAADRLKAELDKFWEEELI